MHISKNKNIFKNNIKIIKYVFILSLLCFGILITLITLYINYYYQINKIYSNLRTEAKKEASDKIKKINTYIESHIDIINSLKNNEIFNNYINNSNDDDNKKINLFLFRQAIESNKSIMQLRFIDKNGFEKVKLKRDSRLSKIKKIENILLQNKKDRYYFKKTKELSANKYYVSNIDLNIENGEIQKPITPTVRLAIPIKEKGNFEGMIILNLFVERLLKELEKSTYFNTFIIDSKGNLIFGKNKEQDLSWSQQLKKTVNIEDYLGISFDKIFEMDNYYSSIIFSKRISTNVIHHQKLFMILQAKEELIYNNKEIIKNNILKIVLIIVFLSIIIGFLLSLIPINQIKKALSLEDKLVDNKNLLDEYIKAMNIHNIISKSDLKGNITYVNDNFSKVTGYQKEEVLGKPHSLLRSKETKKETFIDLWQTIHNNKVWTGILKNKKKNGDFYFVNIAIVPITNKEDEVIEYVGIRHEITELIKQKEEVLFSLKNDNLTKCPNRVKLVEDLEKSEKNNLAVIDIDDFSSINDFYGHLIGDVVIVQFAKLIQSLLDKNFKLYRLHADKFAILNNSLPKKDFIKFMNLINIKIVDSKINIDIKSFDISPSIGISFENKYELLITAEIANKHAKKINKDVFTYQKKFQIERDVEDNLIWIEKIKRSIKENRIIVLYQPIYNNRTNKVEKYEVLVRLKEIDGKLISPYYFLEIAKKYKQYTNLTKRVIDLSFEKFKYSNYEFSINLTVEDILNEEINAYLIRKINEYNIGNKLVIELVESENIENFNQVLNFMNLIKTYGCKIAIDDFGTGYSNFEYLLRINADYLKIDGSLIENIDSNKTSKDVVQTIINFAHKMDYKVIAEYVSNKSIFNEVNQLGIDYSQGYYIGVPDEEILKEN